MVTTQVQGQSKQEVSSCQQQLVSSQRLRAWSFRLILASKIFAAGFFLLNSHFCGSPRPRPLPPSIFAPKASQTTNYSQRLATTESCCVPTVTADQSAARMTLLKATPLLACIVTIQGVGGASVTPERALFTDARPNNAVAMVSGRGYGR